VGTAVAEALKGVNRAEEDNNEESEEAQSTASPDLGGKLDALIATVTRYDEKVDKLAEKIQEHGEAVEKLKGEAVARSDTDDDDANDANVAPARDAFDGIFGTFHGRRRYS
jgi:predicted RNase H-like nuclease (RuvC/YqgF family)